MRLMALRPILLQGGQDGREDAPTLAFLAEPFVQGMRGLGARAELPSRCSPRPPRHRERAKEGALPL